MQLNMYVRICKYALAAFTSVSDSGAPTGFLTVVLDSDKANLETRSGSAICSAWNYLIQQTLLHCTGNRGLIIIGRPNTRPRPPRDFGLQINRVSPAPSFLSFPL